MRGDAQRARARRAAAGRARESRAHARSALACAAIAASLAACGSLERLSRPDGDGGWSADKRRIEVEQIGRAAGVAVDGVRAADAPASPSGAAASGAPAGPAPSAPAAGSSNGSSSARSDGSALPIEASATPAGVRPPGDRAASRLDLPTALAMAERGNRRIQSAQRELDATGERVRDVRGRLLPATSANARYTWYTDAQTTKVDLPPGLLPPGTATPVVTVRDTENGVVNSTVAVPLDLTGELWHTLAAAQAGYRGERARVWAVTLEQQLRVVQAYFDLLEALRLREVAEDTLAVYRRQYAIADDRFRNGRLTKNDLLTFDVARRDAEHAILQRDLAIERARWSLNDAIGADVDRPLTPVDVRRRPDVPETAQALRLAYDHNPVLVALLEEQQRLEETVTALVRSRLPRFQGGGAVDYQSSGLLQPPAIGSGFVGLTWDLGTDLRREAQVAQARIDADRNRVDIERQMRELEAAVRTAQLAAVERVAAFETAESAVNQAEENLRIREQQFDVGRAQSDDVLVAERLLASQRATLASALYQAHVRRAELQRLIGLPIEME